MSPFHGTRHRPAISPTEVSLSTHERTTSGKVGCVGRGRVGSVRVVVRLAFMCGPAGSGKSTVARALERDGLVRLSFDQETWNRGLRTMPLASADHAEIETVLRHRLVELVGQGRDVVLDFSFWSRRMRQDWRALLTPLGVSPEVIYLTTDRQTCLARINQRAAEHGDDFVLDPQFAAAYFDGFEAPTDDEGPLTLIAPQQ